MTTQLGMLTVLEMCGDRLLPETVLLADTERLLNQEITLSTLKAEARKLEQKGQILTVQSEDHGTRYRITDEGRARLRA